MVRSMAHNIYKTKLVIPFTQTDILPQHKLFLCGYAVLNQTVWYILTVPRIIGIELYTPLMTFKPFSTIHRHSNYWGWLYERWISYPVDKSYPMDKSPIQWVAICQIKMHCTKHG